MGDWIKEMTTRKDTAQLIKASPTSFAISLFHCDNGADLLVMTSIVADMKS